MQSIGKLYGYYQQTLMPDIKTLEEIRIKIAKKLLAFGAVIAIVVAFLVWVFASTSGESSDNIKGIFYSIFGGIAIFSWLIRHFSKSYVCDFKGLVIKRIVHFIDPELSYKSQGCVLQRDYLASEIFKRKVDVYTGDDCVSGTRGQTKIIFSELHTQYITRGSKGQTYYHDIFKGLFFVGDFNKHFKGKTFVLPDVAERVFGGIGTMFQGMDKRRGELVKLEDIAFEKEFAVYGDDQIEARYILSTSLMKRILDFQKKSGKKISLSFINSKMFIAIPYKRNLFEPRIFKTLIDFSPIKKYYEDFELAIGIVDDLNLNTRIWTKA